MKINLPAALKWVAAFGAAEWLQIPSAMRALMIFMVLDYATGIGAAIVRHEVSSWIAWRGLVRKSMVFVLLIGVAVGQKLAGLDLHLEQAGAIGFVISEFISMVENCAKAGVPIPEQVVNALLMAKKIQRTATPEQVKQLGE